MIVLNQPEVVNTWVGGQGGGLAAPGTYTAMGWVEDHQLLAGAVFSGYNGKHCLVNVASVAREKDRIPVALVKAGLRYAFGQLLLRRLTFLISESNITSQNLARAFGAKLEATLQDADPDGNLLIFALFPEDCKIWSRLNGNIRQGQYGAGITRSSHHNSAARSV